MQYKSFVLSFLVCLFVLTATSPTLATDNDLRDLRLEQSNDYVCDTLKEDCSQQKDVEIVTIDD